jgi:plastocyanin
MCDYMVFKGEKEAMKKFITAFVLMFMVTVLVVACGGSSGSSSSGSSSSSSSPSSSSPSSSSGSNTVHMTSNNFAQSSITISKGSSITLVDDAAVTHIISNGRWQNNTPKPATESGAPVVRNVIFNSSGQSKTIGPFNTAGTYHFYCSVHVGMNLTVAVQ